MREIVIVIADLFLPPSPDGAAGDDPGFSSASQSTGFERIIRFGNKRSSGPGGWRAWLAHHLGRDDLAKVPPAVIAAATLDARPAAGSTAWLATPLHRIAGLTSVHLDRRSLLSLSAEEAAGLVADFNRIFGDDPSSALRLHALASGTLLLEAPADMIATTTEPARALVAGLEDSLPSGPRATPLKRLGAEVEMWLHSHPLNIFRTRRGELPVNAFWLWGGGPAHEILQAGAVASGPGTPMLLGTDSYLSGLAHLSGLATWPLPAGLDAARLTTDMQRTVLLTGITPFLHANPTLSVLDAVADLDRRFISPAVAALHAGTIERLTLLVNDIELHARRHDRLKFWRRYQGVLAGLAGGGR